MAQHFHWIVPLANGMGMFPNIKFPKTLTTYQPTYLLTRRTYLWTQKTGELKIAEFGFTIIKSWTKFEPPL